jgi:trk system potassium uptake protein TrkA
MNLVIVGCGRLGAQLTAALSRKGHRVTVIDHVAAAFDNLPADFRGRTVEGEVLNQDVLCRADIEQAEGLAAVTNSDALNAAVAHVARIVYGIDNIVVRNYDPRWRSVQEAMGLQIVSSTSWGARRIEEMLYQSDIHPVASAGNGEVKVYEFALPEAWDGRTLRELLAGDECLAAALTRAGQASLPSPETLLKTGDVVYVSATLAGMETLNQRLVQPEEG